MAEFWVSRPRKPVRGLTFPKCDFLGPDQLDESFPIHINNTFMFPVGYAEKNGLELADPDSFEGTFKWDEYLEKENAERMPLELFRTEPSEERLNMFQVGENSSENR